MKVHGLTEEFLKEEGVPSEEGVMRFMNWVGDSPLVAHNAKFVVSLVSKFHCLALTCACCTRNLILLMRARVYED